VEAKELSKFATTDVEHAKILHEASRVAICMQSYRDALDFLKKAAELEGDLNAETYSDMARCIYLSRDIDAIKEIGS